MLTFRLRLVAGLLGLAVAGLAGSAAARSPSCEPVERYTLKNGLEVVLLADHALPNVAIVSSVHAGHRNDPPGYEGLAHYVEHLTFREALSQGSIEELYKQAGATGVNATTAVDKTDYFAQLPRAQLERGLWIEARRIAIGLDALQAAASEDERRVVLREFELRFGGGNALEVLGATYGALFPPGHPYHELRRQTEASVGALTLHDARWFFARYYRPDRIRLSVVGDFEPAAAKPLIEKYFAALAPRALPPAPGAAAASEAELDAAECRRGEVSGPPLHGSVVVKRRGRQEGVTFLWRSPLGQDSERFLGILDAFTRRVGQAARDANLASGARIDLVPSEFGDFWALSLGLLPAQPFEKVAPLVSSVFAELKRAPLDASEQLAQRQALELSEAARGLYLARALNLSRRECRPSRCLSPGDLMSPEAVAGFDHFDPARALRVELRHSLGASLDGDVERLP